MGRTRVQTRANADTVDALNEYADDHDLSQSEAVRRMLRSGLSKNGYQIAEADGLGASEIEELRNELSEIEQRQAARANQRYRLELAQAYSVFAALAYLIFTVGLGADGPLWTAVGVMSVVGYVAAHLWATRLGGDADE